MAACAAAVAPYLVPDAITTKSVVSRSAQSQCRSRGNFSPQASRRGYEGGSCSCETGRSLRDRTLGALRVPSRQVARRGLLPKTTASAMDASLGGEEAGPPAVFSRIGVRDPYKRLGLGRDASTEEIQEAKNYLLEEYAGHERSREAIEQAYDKIIAEKFVLRKRTKMNLKADLKKRVAESPPWVQSLLAMAEVPKGSVIVQRLVLFVLLAAWSIMNPSEGGPAFQVAVALAASVYLLNDRLKSLGRSFTLGFIGLVVGWVVGSIVVPFAPAALLPRFWSLELGTALVTYFFLWLATTFLK